MPEIVVKIEWDTPTNRMWLNPDNIAIALHAYCTNTRFVVTEAAEHQLHGTGYPPQVIRDWVGEDEDKAWAHLDNPHAPE